MADVISMEKPMPKYIGTKEVAKLLNVSEGWVRMNAASIPGYLRVNAISRNSLHRWDLNKILAWQDEQGKQRSA